MGRLFDDPIGHEKQIRCNNLVGLSFSVAPHTATSAYVWVLDVNAVSVVLNSGPYENHH